MKSKRIKADNVEQLIEIIRSLKEEGDGEKPGSLRSDYSVLPKEPPLEASKASSYLEQIEKETPRVPSGFSQETEEAQEEWEEEDEDDFFENDLKEEEESSFVDPKKVRNALASLADAAKGAARRGKELLGAVREKARSLKKEKKPKEQPEPESIENEAERPEGETPDQTEEKPQAAEPKEPEAGTEAAEAKEPEAPKEAEEQPEEEAAKEPEAPKEPEKQPEEEAAREPETPKEPEKKPEEEAKDEKKSETEAAKKAGSAARLWENIRGRIRNAAAFLNQKDIGKKERVLIGIGGVLAVLFVVLLVQLVWSTLERNHKTRNVTADSGLTVTVEEEPEEWCSQARITLGVSVADGPVTQVKIDGEAYVPDENGRIQFVTGNSRLEAEVTTEKGALSASIEIPMLDGAPPSVTASLKEGKIEVLAEDTRSSVDQIYYAAVNPDSILTIPLYQTYTEPFEYEEGMLYSFYARDKAGNRSVPFQTTMEEAESLELSTEELNLIIGDSASLGVSARPEGALLGHLTFESLNPELLEVTENGKVTALAAGKGSVRVQADGVKEAVCTVDIQAERTVTITALGDCTLGTDESFNTSTNFDAFNIVNGPTYFFENVRDILENDDATFANFEGTLTTETTRENKEYAFKGDPSYTEILTDGSIEVVTLANNHSSDYGAQSLTDTETYLTDAGIDYCLGDAIAYQELNGVKTAFIGIYVLDDGMEREEQVRQTIAQAKEEGAQLVIVAFHWGSEKATAPDETQQTLAHIAVDCGADLVVGHHPHVLQGIELYKGKYIAYSLGNFCFGGNSAPSDMDTILFRQTFTIEEGGARADAKAEIIPCSISSASGYNNYQPTPAQGSEADRIMAKLNECCAAFGTSFEASDGLAS